MNLQERFLFLLTNPDYATSDLLEYSGVRDGFVVVTIYATLASLQALLSAILVINNITFGIITFVGSFVSIFIIWAVLSGVFHLLSVWGGGSGDLVSTFGAIGLAAAPMIVVSMLAILSTITSLILFPEDYELIMPYVRLFMALLSAAWGWPGLLCYFVLKNVELMEPRRAFFIIIVAFAIIGGYEVYSSGLLF